MIEYERDPFPELQLVEVEETESERAHRKMMECFVRINQNVDRIIEKKREKLEQKS